MDENFERNFADLSLEKIAEIQSEIAYREGDQSFEEKILKSERITQERWEKANKLLFEGIDNDESKKLYQRYVQLCFEYSKGKFEEYGKNISNVLLGSEPLLENPPVSLENWVQIKEALEVARWSKIDTRKEVKKFGIAIYDWDIISTWWKLKFAEAELIKDKAIISQYQKLTKTYRSRYTNK